MSVKEATVFEDKLEEIQVQPCLVTASMCSRSSRVEVPTEMQIDEDAGRLNFSPPQLERLDREYMMDKNPSIEWRNELAKEFQVPAKKIHYWYSRSRQKDGYSEKAFKYVNDIATKINLPKNITDMANGLF